MYDICSANEVHNNKILKVWTENCMWCVFWKLSWDDSVIFWWVWNHFFFGCSCAFQWYMTTHTFDNISLRKCWKCTENLVLNGHQLFVSLTLHCMQWLTPFKVWFFVYFQYFWREMLSKVWVVIYHWKAHEQPKKKWLHTHPKITESSQLSFQNTNHMQFSNQTLRILLLWTSFAEQKSHTKWKLRQWRVHRYSQF